METLFNSPDKWSSEFVTADNYKTHYIEAGKSNSQPLLLVHGGACEIGMGNYRWYPNILPLAEKFHVYAIDELGHGLTDAPRNLKNLGHVRTRAEHVINFIEELNLGPVNLAGQSQGGWIVTFIAIKRPDLVNKLILIDSGSTAGSAVKKDEEQKKNQFIEVDGGKVEVDGSGDLPYFKEVFKPGTMMPKEGLTTTHEGLTKYIGVFVQNKGMITNEFVEHLMGLSKRWNSVYLENYGDDYWQGGLDGHTNMYFYDDKHIREHVHKIKTPTLVIWGRNSNKGIDPGYELYKSIPNAQMHIFSQANHFLWLDQPDDFNSLVKWFLS